jgi:hypothetical protein
LHHARDTIIRDKAVKGTLRGWMFGRRRWAKLEDSNGIRKRDFKEQLHLGSEKTSRGIYGKGLALEIVNEKS